MADEKKILVVEDEGIVALDIQMQLEQMGYTVCNIAATGKDAIHFADSQKPDLILMDINLKGPMNGIQAAEEIRTNQDVPIVYLTANTDNQSLNQAKLTAPYGYIMKPFNERALFATIESAFQRYLDEKRVLEQSQKQVSQAFELSLHVLRTLDEEIAHSLDIDFVLRRVLATAMNLSKSHRGYVGILGGNSWLNLKTDNYPPEEAHHHLTFHSYAIAALEQGRAIFIPDITREEGELPIDFNTRSQIIVPFIARDNIFGILNLETENSDLFNSSIFGMMQMLVSRTALVIDNARLFQQSQSQIEQLRELHEEIVSQSYLDALTALPNRRRLEEYLDELIRNADAEDTKFAIFCIDLDDFKEVNDNYGHPTGDKLLKEVGRKLSGIIQPGDLIARLGGDEFLIVKLLDEHSVLPSEFAEDIIKRISNTTQVEDYTVHIGASVGYSVFPRDGNKRVDLVRRADRALYYAKELGRNRFQQYHPGLKTAFSDATLSQQLQGAIERDELVLHYQPLQESLTGEIIGVEALLRWQHPYWGIIMPDQFISVARKRELIIPITEWILRTVTKQQKNWKEEGYNVFVSINVTSVQFETREFVEAIAWVLSQKELEPQHLKIEITEDIALSGGSSEMYLQEISKLGVEIAIDDFGKGYSSFDYLQKDYLNYIKIDQFLTRGIGSSPELSKRSKEIIGAIIELAHRLNIKVVVEGVETEEQYNFLLEIGCDIIQGYWVGRPMSASDLLAFMTGLEN